MENGPFEDVFPIENDDFHCYVSLPQGKKCVFVKKVTPSQTWSILGIHVRFSGL